MDVIGEMKDKEFGVLKLWKIQEETASSWNSIKDDSSNSGKGKNNGRCSQIVHKLYKIV